MRSRNVRYLPSVDHLRLLAAVLVLIHHGTIALPAPPGADGRPRLGPLPQPHSILATLALHGHTGVSLFMVVSGFILTYGALGRELDYGSFLRNRALRILPMLLVLTAFAVYTYPQGISITRVFNSLLSLPFGLDLGFFYSVTWSVFVEMQFYLVFPFLVRMLDREGPTALLRILAVVVLFRIGAIALGAGPTGILYYTLVGRIDQFLIGMLAAWCMRRRPGRQWGLMLGPGAFAVLLILSSLPPSNLLDGLSWSALWPTVEGLAWAGFLVGYVGLMGAARGVPSRLLAWAGERTYSVYLVHYVVIVLMWRAHLMLHPVRSVWVDASVTAAVIALPIAFAVASLTYAAIEAPFLRLRGRYILERPELPARVVHLQRGA